MNSNTSHVIVYRLSDNSERLAGKFKYISCYCLSTLAAPLRSYRSTFKYISCYCLSCFLTTASNRMAYSNTSHVIVYRIINCKIGGKNRFKYISCYCLSSRRIIRKLRKNIQIHLMLLFIPHFFAFLNNHYTLYISNFQSFCNFSHPYLSFPSVLYNLPYFPDICGIILLSYTKPPGKIIELNSLRFLHLQRLKFPLQTHYHSLI